MSYQAAQKAAEKMAARNQRSDRCHIPGDHGWHVVFYGRMNYPCGGGSTTVSVKGWANS